jgi:hypothetical protein
MERGDPNPNLRMILGELNPNTPWFSGTIENYLESADDMPTIDLGIVPHPVVPKKKGQHVHPRGHNQWEPYPGILGSKQFGSRKSATSELHSQTGYRWQQSSNCKSPPATIKQCASHANCEARVKILQVEVDSFLVLSNGVAHNGIVAPTVTGIPPGYLQLVDDLLLAGHLSKPYVVHTHLMISHWDGMEASKALLPTHTQVRARARYLRQTTAGVAAISTLGDLEAFVSENKCPDTAAGFLELNPVECYVLPSGAQYDPVYGPVVVMTNNLTGSNVKAEADSHNEGSYVCSLCPRFVTPGFSTYCANSRLVDNIPGFLDWTCERLYRFCTGFVCVFLYHKCAYLTQLIRVCAAHFSLYCDGTFTHQTGGFVTLNFGTSSLHAPTGHLWLTFDDVRHRPRHTWRSYAIASCKSTSLLLFPHILPRKLTFPAPRIFVTAISAMLFMYFLCMLILVIQGLRSFWF